MYKSCSYLLLVSMLAVIAAGTQSREYLPRRQPQAYFYSTPTPPGTMAALRRIIQGHLHRFQQADSAQFSRRALNHQAKTEVGSKTMQLLVYRMPAASENILDYALPPNTPTPKNYAQNFLPDGKDVVPGSSYIPLRLLLIRR
ncbi:uncharacterized protein LOC117583083 [Drosophila guanche]|uniref:Uncharacterized protein n=1 Tax=Drosophila guanche TaxID=7266 RepID=A0A3B0JKI4_DROGU|nr:uncharacterized protein LOC117583083 [Drosophila guanche]SPP80832.1 Hypothetical predicted protein [Drosophila guanche]